MIYIIEHLQGCRDGLRDHDPTCCFRFRDLPHEDAEASMRLLAIEMLPDVEERPGATRGARS